MEKGALAGGALFIGGTLAACLISLEWNVPAQGRPKRKSRTKPCSAFECSPVAAAVAGRNAPLGKRPAPVSGRREGTCRPSGGESSG